jgi:ATP-dependent DNA helicase RecG
MRPSILDPFFATLSSLPGVGPKLAAAFNRLLSDEEHPARITDLIFHLPRGGVDRRVRASIADAPVGEPVTLKVTVASHRPAPFGKGRAPYRVLTEDESGDVTLVYFAAQRARMEALLPIGEERFISGRIELFDGRRQMVHPDRVLDAKGFGTLPDVEPIYGLTEGLGMRIVGKTVAAALERMPHLPEWQDAAWHTRNRWPDFAEALRTLHIPASPDDLKPEALAESPARCRLAYDELLATQLALALVRASSKRAAGRINVGNGELVARVEAALPFKLTGAQTRAVAEIRADLASPQRMLRLVQGDVGSGKTAVALLAMASVVEAGRQAAFMAPTDILARQHYDRLSPLASMVGISIGVLTGRDKGRAREDILQKLANGDLQMVVGTHALFQQSVAFHDLGLAVVDEQHRFGVHQRLALGAKGEAADVLVMTATPIPRTLAMTYFGDMDVSVLDEKPAGRQPIVTRAIPLSRLDEIVDGVGRGITTGARVYWVCPLVAESEILDVAAAEERHSELKALFGNKVGLLHGKMTPRDKDAAMASFQSGETTILVSTTVIEVGVDVPEATIMVVEHAERFGLAQLHQLRGRIGRGTAASSCILLYKAPLSETATARLAILRETEDGFRIAEEDLKLRGEGEVLGSRQSGAPDFRLANPETDAELIAAARDDARLIIDRDPGLKSPRGEALRLLLYLFERDAAIRLLRAG